MGNLWHLGGRKNLKGSKRAEVCELGNPCLFQMLSVKAQKAPSQINFAYFQRPLMDVSTDVFSGNQKQRIMHEALLELAAGHVV